MRTMTEWKSFKCNCCGGELVEKDGVRICKYCKTKFEEVETVSVEALNRANEYRNRLRFDDALVEYDIILQGAPKSIEASWGAFLCEYGIVYEKDYNGQYKPTCHRLNERPVSKSKYYSKLTATKKEKAKEIETLRQDVLKKSKDIQPYDVFICYKATEERNGMHFPTEESKWARDVYEMLTYEMGLRVFFAEKSLVGSNTDYEPHIYAALRSAKLMLVLTSKLDNVNSVWVANEWKRYASYIREGEEKTIRVVYEKLDPYDLPRELQEKQAIDQDTRGWDEAVKKAAQDIFNKKPMPKPTPNPEPMPKPQPTVPQESFGEKLGEFFSPFLEWLGENFGKIIIPLLIVAGIVIGIVSCNAQEKKKYSHENISISVLSKENQGTDYDGTLKILFKIKVKNGCTVDISGLDGLMTLRNANGTDLDVVSVDLSGTAYAGKENTWTLTLRVNPKYEYAEELWYSTYEDLEIAFKITEASFADYTYKEYTDSKEIIIKTSSGGVSGLETIENSYQNALNLYNQGRYEEAKQMFAELGSYKDSRNYYDWCCSHIENAAIEKENAIKEAAYKDALNVYNQGNYEQAKRMFAELGSYKDSSEYYYLCCEKIEIAEMDAVYERAMSLYAQEKYGEAVALLNEIYGHKDSVAKVEEITLAAAMKVAALEELGDYVGACAVLEQFGGEMTSSDLYKAYSYAIQGNFAKAVNYGLTVVVFPEGTETIPDNYFKDEYGYSELRKVVLPSTLTSIGESAFYGCQELEEINLPDGIVTIAKAAFQSCVSLKNIQLPGGLLAISDNAFYNCSSLGAIELPANLINIGKSAFSGCALREIVWNNNLQTIGNYAFKYCDLTSLRLPSSLKSLGKGAFSNCGELITVSIGGGLKNIAENAFDYCVKLTQVTIAEGVEVIEAYAFNDCYMLTTVSLPNSLKKIMGNAFYDCATLTEITIPAQVTFIGAYAFSGSSLKNVYFDNTEGWLQSGAISLNVSDPQKNAQKLTSSGVTNWSRSE